MNYSMPSFMIETGSKGNDDQLECWSYLKRRKIYITHENYNPKPFYQQIDNANICIIGNPVYREKINHPCLYEDLIRNQTNVRWLQDLDSEFVIILSEKSTLKIITSRFSSPPFFYYHDQECFIGSFSYYDLCVRLNKLDKLILTPESFYDLIAYKRIFGHKTHSRNTRMMPPASVLEYSGSGVNIERYWNPKFNKKTGKKLDDCAYELSERIKNAIIKKTSDNPRPALFLTGGLDARILLAAFNKIEKLPVCITINPFENREVKVAQKLASAVGARHIFMKLEENHYKKYFNESLQVVGAMQLPIFIFLGFSDEVRKHADVAFHGHGFDYFFQGKYLPKKVFKMFNKPLQYTRLKTLREPLISYFMNNISYRVGDTDKFQIIKTKFARDLSDRLRSELELIEKEARQFVSNIYDLIEYLTFYNLARHYSFGDHWGINTNIPQRTISFDNDIYDFYQSLPARYRFDATILRKCLKLINPKLANIISANTTYPAKASSLQRTFYQITDYILRKCSLKPEYKNDNAFQRMGLPLFHVLTNDLRPFVEDLLKTDRLSLLYYLDMDKVRNYIRNYLIRPSGNGQLLLALITIDNFLKQIDKR